MMTSATAVGHNRQMRRPTRRFGWRGATASLVLLGAGIFLTPPAFGTVMIPLSVEDLSQKCGAVVEARVLSKKSQWDAEHKRIFTTTTLEVLDRIDGPSDLPKTVEVQTLGGTVDGYGMNVSGSENFEIGEQVVVFLKKPAGGREKPFFRVVGMSQGKFQVQVDSASGERSVVPAVSGMSFARPDATGTLRVAENQKALTRVMGMREFKERVQTARRAQRP
jgi:hypothetical protein